MTSTPVLEPQSSVSVQKFDFSPGIIFMLTNGFCWQLAATLHARTGLPYIALYGDRVMKHVAVELPNGLIVDVEGVWECDDWAARWEKDLSGQVLAVGEADTEDDYYEDYLEHPNPYFEHEGYCGVSLREIVNTIIAKLGL